MYSYSLSAGVCGPRSPQCCTCSPAPRSRACSRTPPSPTAAPPPAATSTNSCPSSTEAAELRRSQTWASPTHMGRQVIALKNAILPHFVDAQVLAAVLPPLDCGQVCSASSSSSSPYLWLFRWLCLYFRNELKKSEPQVIVFFRIWFPANEPRRSCHSCRRRARGRTVTPPWKMGLFCRRFGSASIRLPTE